MPTTRCLRPTGPNTWDVLIDDAPPVDPTPQEDDEYGPPPPVVGRRTPGTPVAHITASEALGRIGYVATDLQGKVLGEDADLTRLAQRIAEGEFDNDFRFEYFLNPEPSCPADLYYIAQVAIPSQLPIDDFTTHDPGAVIEAAREAQVYTLEERLGDFGLEWQREQAERGR